MNYTIYWLKLLGLFMLLFLTVFFLFDILLLIGSGYQIWISISISLVLLICCYVLYKKTDGFNSIILKNTKS